MLALLVGHVRRVNADAEVEGFLEAKDFAEFIRLIVCAHDGEYCEKEVKAHGFFDNLSTVRQSMAPSITSKQETRHDFRMTAVRFVADAVNRTLNLREIADNALDAVLAVTQLDAGAMYTWVKEDEAFHLYAWRSLTEAFTRQVMVIRPKDDALIDKVVKEGTWVTEDFVVATGGKGHEPLRAGFASAVLCPIRAQGGTVALLVLGAYQQEVFDPETLDLIEVIASQIGISITNARLFEDVDRKNELLQLLIEEAHHRIKNNLQMISGLLQLELSASEGRAAERLQHAISEIQAIAQVHNLLSEKMPDRVDSQALVRVIVETLFNSASAAGIAPQVEMELDRIWLAADQAVPLALVVNELVSNSLMHGHPREGESLRLSIRCVSDGNTVSVVVQDNGGGIPATTDSTGQGMSIIRQLAQVNLQGQLTMENRDDGVYAGLRFPMTLQPQAGA